VQERKCSKRLGYRFDGHVPWERALGILVQCFQGIIGAPPSFQIRHEKHMCAQLRNHIIVQRGQHQMLE
jgi:hypothetical protein